MGNAVVTARLGVPRVAVGVHCQLILLAWLLVPVSVSVSSSQITGGLAAIELVRSFRGFTFRESLLLQPCGLVRVTIYFVGTGGYTIGVPVLPPVIKVRGVQLKFPVPVAVS